jgi:hypothetical protein
VREYRTVLSGACAADLCADPRAMVAHVLRSLLAEYKTTHRAAGHHALHRGTVLAAVNAAPGVRGQLHVHESGVDRGCAQCRFQATA